MSEENIATAPGLLRCENYLPTEALWEWAQFEIRLNGSSRQHFVLKKSVRECVWLERGARNFGVSRCAESKEPKRKLLRKGEAKEGERAP
ncbi:hypothetical protein ZHAS_00008297 [Anopheles sinensis]|uniref:Uncharacterized protein n=1 Tax=Anopheles sinensis TaxID=74873 RepID=A0A084VRT5_ANOSI|nr:hypothetical protein ZHAS_00008297 [Anopheles sinensis]